MPGFDGTGPAGSGPMTGGGRGYCGLSGSYGSGRPRIGRNVGFGYGRGRGYRSFLGETGMFRRGQGDPSMRGPYSRAGVSGKSEVTMLKGEAEGLKGDLDVIQARINDLEKEQELDK